MKTVNPENIEGLCIFVSNFYTGQITSHEMCPWIYEHNVF